MLTAHCAGIDDMIRMPAAREKVAMQGFINHLFVTHLEEEGAHSLWLVANQGWRDREPHLAGDVQLQRLKTGGALCIKGIDPQTIQAPQHAANPSIRFVL